MQCSLSSIPTKKKETLRQLDINLFLQKIKILIHTLVSMSDAVLLQYRTLEIVRNPES